MNHLKHIASLAVSCFVCCHTFSQSRADTTYLQSAIERYPDSLELHKAYINAFYKETRNAYDSAQMPSYSEVIKGLRYQYNEWIKRFPTSYIVPFAIGNALCNAELPEAKDYLQKATDLNPGYAPAWMDLWLDADRWGDFEKGQQYIEKAALADPQSPDYAFYSIIDLDKSDTIRWKNKIYDLARKFPASERGAQALYWLGVRSRSDSIKTAAFEYLRKWYPPDKFNWSEYGMENYFDWLLTMRHWNKAWSLSEYMNSLDSLGDPKETWKNNQNLSAKLIAIDRLLKERRGDSAYAIVQMLKVNKWYASNETIKLLKTEIMAATGNTATAYDSLVSYFAVEPKEIFYEKLILFGKDLGKTPETINKDVWEKRTRLSKMATPFTLAEYLKNDSLSLSDLKGKVVLLTFWFPGCGPCRGEFPHFESALKDFNKDSIAYIGINVDSSQDPYVVPFMRHSRYSFTPLHGSWQWALKNYHVRGAPENFLIDQAGKIIYSGFRVDDQPAEENFKRMMRSLLNKNKLD